MGTVKTAVRGTIAIGSGAVALAALKELRENGDPEALLVAAIAGGVAYSVIKAELQDLAGPKES